MIIPSQTHFANWTTGPDKGCDYIGPGWLEFTGTTWEQNQGFGWKNAIHPDDLPEINRRYNEAWTDAKCFLAVFRLRHHTGQYRWVVGQGQPLLDDDHQVIGFRGWNDLFPLESIAEPAGMVGISPHQSLTGVHEYLDRLSAAHRVFGNSITAKTEVYSALSAIIHRSAIEQRAHEMGIEIVDLRNFHFKKDEEEQS